MSKVGSGLLVSTLGSMARQDESYTSVTRRLAAQLNVSDSTIRRAISNDRISPYLQDKLNAHFLKLDQWQKRMIYYGLARLERTTNPRVRDKSIQTALRDGGKWRGEVSDYRKRIQRQARAKLRRLAKMYGEDIFLMGDTPKA